MHEWRKSGKATRGTIIEQRKGLLANYELDSCQALESAPFHLPKPRDQHSQFCMTNLHLFRKARASLFIGGAALHIGALCLLVGQLCIPRNFAATSRHNCTFWLQVLGSWVASGTLLVGIALLAHLPWQLRRFEMHVPWNRNSTVVCDNLSYHVADQTHLYVGTAMLALPAAIVATIWALLMTGMLVSPDRKVSAKPRVGINAPLLGDCESTVSDDEDEETGGHRATDYAAAHVQLQDTLLRNDAMV